jgi:TPP-dependent pyruvate/acetoin dehydrogenase alpha subunit
MAEIMGKSAGVCGGIGGSQHLCTDGFKSNGILGGTVPAAAGIALAMNLSGEDGISVAFIGDGTFGEGILYETLNIASLWKLPLLVVVENNQYAQSTPIAANLAGTITARFESFGIEVRHLDSTDVLEIDRASEVLVQEVRTTRTPRALVIDTYRLCHHSKSDDNRPEDEISARWLREPLSVHAARLPDETRALIDSDVEAAIADVVRTARELP